MEHYSEKYWCQPKPKLNRKPKKTETFFYFLTEPKPIPKGVIFFGFGLKKL
jgi:hypothetical protein